MPFRALCFDASAQAAERWADALLGAGALSVGSVAVGSFALGASAFGALAVGALAIRRYVCVEDARCPSTSSTMPPVSS